MPLRRCFLSTRSPPKKGKPLVDVNRMTLRKKPLANLINMALVDAYYVNAVRRKADCFAFYRMT